MYPGKSVTVVRPDVQRGFQKRYNENPPKGAFVAVKKEGWHL